MTDGELLECLQFVNKNTIHDEKILKTIHHRKTFKQRSHMNSQVKKVAVIGAGPAGLAAGYQLSNYGVDVTIYEASDTVGGMAKTIPLWGQFVDLGPHRFFSHDTRVNKLWVDMLDGKYSMVSRLTRIYYNNTFFDYPLKAFNAVYGLGVLESAHCIASYAKSCFMSDEDSNRSFESWVTKRFGARLFSIFFKSYSEKLWGIPCSELSADFAAQRIKKLSLFEAAKAAVLGNKDNKHKTLVEEFAYPNNGAGMLYESLAAAIVNNGGTIQKNTIIQAVKIQEGDPNVPILILDDARRIAFDHVISSMPLTDLIFGIGAPKTVIASAQKLKFRNTILVYLLIDGVSPFPDQWIYIHQKNMKTGRITNFKNWTPTINKGKKETILCLEYWCYNEDAIWNTSDESLIAIAKDDIIKTQLLANSAVISGHVVRIPKCYPVYESGYTQHIDAIREYMQGIKCITPIGRYGSFKYNNQDHSIIMGLLAAENIANNGEYNIWDINTDYEYQESSKITEVGLSNQA
jgi:protoporphyrinogen oxidase